MNLTSLCLDCGERPSAGKDELCRTCRGRRTSFHLLKHRKVFSFNEAQGRQIRRIYGFPRSQARAGRQELSLELDKLARQFGYPKRVLVRRAGMLGLSVWTHTRWSHEEIQIIESNAGVKTPTAILRLLRQRGFLRGRMALNAKLSRLKRSQRPLEGYSQAELAELFGVASRTIATWERRGWMERSGDTERFDDETVLRFLKRYPQEWHFRQVDEAWVKGLLFPTFNTVDRNSSMDGRDVKNLSYRVSLDAVY